MSVILNAYSVYDSKAKSYITPFFLPTHEMAIRTFSQMTCDPNHTFGAFPRDFTLVEVGRFDTSTGVFIEHTKVDIIQGDAARQSYLNYYKTKDLITEEENSK
jgi:hypothetical protein